MLFLLSFPFLFFPFQFCFQFVFRQFPRAFNEALVSPLVFRVNTLFFVCKFFDKSPFFNQYDYEYFSYYLYLEKLVGICLSSFHSIRSFPQEKLLPIFVLSFLFCHVALSSKAVLIFNFIQKGKYIYIIICKNYI